MNLYLYEMEMLVPQYRYEKVHFFAEITLKSTTRSIVQVVIIGPIKGSKYINNE